MRTRKATIDNMLAWSDLTYGVATGRVGAEADYCEHFSQGSAIDDLMKPNSFPFCSPADGMDSIANPWRVHTIFSMRCSNPLSSANCTEFTGDGGAEMARRNATGALLHMVQDSYSQAHAVRGAKPEGNGFEARIECRKIKSFYNYNDQMDEGAEHSQADKRPRFDTSCFENGSIADPVTASAVLLWHIKNNSDPAIVRGYLSEMVFRPA